LSARLASKYLQVPVSLIADKDTIANIHNNFSSSKLPFDKIIEVSKPQQDNKRRLRLSPDPKTLLDFINGNRSSVWYLTPYDRTLVIDSDFLIFSDTLGKYWNDPHELLITPGMLNLQENNHSPREYPISEYTINQLWATNIMFTKSEETKILFDLVDYIKDNYEYFSYLYEFNNAMFRNDYAFSIACHIMSAYGLEPCYGNLPIPLWFIDTDDIFDIKDNGQISFLVKDMQDNFYITRALGQDVHIMNKHAILSNIPKLMELAND
jgi:hypothetical protein